MSTPNENAQTKSLKPANMNFIEWRNNNVAKGMIDALVELGEMLKGMEGADNTGNMEAVIDYIDHTLHAGPPDKYIHARDVQRILDEKGAEALHQYAEAVSKRDTSPRYMNTYLDESGRTTGYLNTLKIIRQLCEMLGY